jgi:protein SCO1/2
VAAFAIFAALLSACSDDGSKDAKSTIISTGDYEAALLVEPKAKPDLVLPDTSGANFDLRQQTNGYLTLLYVGYTHCPDICPLHLVNINAALKQLPPDVAAHVKVVFITSDPARDTPSVLRAYLDNFNPAFIGLVPAEAQLNEVTAKLGMNPVAKEDLGGGNYSVSHAAYVLAFTANDNLAHIGFLGEMEQEIYIHDIPRLAQGWSKK